MGISTGMYKWAPIVNETLVYWDELRPTYPHGIELQHKTHSILGSLRPYLIMLDRGFECFARPRGTRLFFPILKNPNLARLGPFEHPHGIDRRLPRTGRDYRALDWQNKRSDSPAGPSGAAIPIRQTMVDS